MDFQQCLQHNSNLAHEVKPNILHSRRKHLYKDLYIFDLCKPNGLNNHRLLYTQVDNTEEHHYSSANKHKKDYYLQHHISNSNHMVKGYKDLLARHEMVWVQLF